MGSGVLASQFRAQGRSEPWGPGVNADSGFGAWSLGCSFNKALLFATCAAKDQEVFASLPASIGDGGPLG